MDAEERKQVALILEHEGEEALRATSKLQKAMHAEHSAKGLLRSGATVKRAVEIIEDEASAFVLRAVNRVAPVAQDVDAFALIKARLLANFRAWAREVEDAAKLATLGAKARQESVSKAATTLFEQMKVRVTRELDIHSFTFTKPTKGTMAELMSKPNVSQPHDPPKVPNPGGKPLAKHWDAMWAAIAVKLWSGELNPKTQADLKAAMFAWFNKAEIDVGDTAVTQRARQLWQAMQAESS